MPVIPATSIPTTHIPATQDVLPRLGLHSSQKVWADGKHIAELDGLRGLAILVVTIYRFAKQVPTDQVAGLVASRVIILGERGVDLFFVLSGFLITGILLDSRDRANYLRNFFARRTLRIFPLYFLTLAGLLFAIPALFPQSQFFVEAKERQIYLWTYLTNIKISLEGNWCFGALDHFWSLAVEEHFYLMWPFVVWILGRSRTLWFALLMAVLCAIFRIAFAAISTNGVAPDVMSFFRFDGLLLGSAVACAVRGPKGLQSIKHLASIGLGVSALLVVVLELVSGRLLTISHSAWAVLLTCALILLLDSTKTSRVSQIFSSKILRSFGKYSYAMYIFQSPLIPLTAGLFSVASITAGLGYGTESSLLATFIYTAIMFPLTYISAVCSWHLLEKHCLKLKRLF